VGKDELKYPILLLLGKARCPVLPVVVLTLHYRYPRLLYSFRRAKLLGSDICLVMKLQTRDMLAFGEDEGCLSEP
jgi:hypothetical protein